MTHTPLRRKTPMRRTGFTAKPKKRMRQATPELAARRREYTKLNRVFAALPENQVCLVAKSGVLGLPLIRIPTDTHHCGGREGKLLLDFTKCIRVSREGHRWIEQHANEARKRGWLE